MPGREDIFQKAMNEGHSAAWDQEWGKPPGVSQSPAGDARPAQSLNSLGLALFQLGEFDSFADLPNAGRSPAGPRAHGKLAQLLNAQVLKRPFAAGKAAELFPISAM
jgi:hypothetical protein